MDNTLILHVSCPEQTTWHNQNRHITGAGISFLIHAVALCCIIFASSALSNFTPPLVIDFSIEKYDGDMIAQKGVAKIVQQEAPPAPQIKPPPPVPQPLPQKAEVVIPEKIEPIVTKKEIIEKGIGIGKGKGKGKKPKQAETIAVEEQLPEKNDFVPVAGPTTPPSPSLQKEQYKKEHFGYIEERVKSKITYPPIARKMGWQGKVVVSFVICRDGSVKNIRVVKSSGYKALDNNAIKVIKKVAPFPKPPVAAELTIPVTYKLS